jgi:peptide deformylase
MNELSDQFDKMIAAAKVLPLRYWEDPILSVVCAKIEDSEFGSQLEEFGRELLATMSDANGVGLAAPQVGIAKRMFAMLFPDHEEMKPIVVCNPVLFLAGSMTFENEGCLSVPGVRQQVYRTEQATMQYQDPTGKNFEMLLVTPWDARVAQHEFDHLNGIMFFDYKDKRENFATIGHPEPWGARMSKQMSRSALRDWEKEKRKRGL